MSKRLFDWISFKRRRTQEVAPPAVWASGGPQKKIIVLGNCQARPLASCLQALNAGVTAKGAEIPVGTLADRFAQRDPELHLELSQHDLILLQPTFASMVRDNFPDLRDRISFFPALVFSAYHPDIIYISVNSTKRYLRGPLGEYNSAIAFWGYSNGLSVTDTVGLFNERVYEALGYFDYWDASQQTLLTEGAMADMSLGVHLDRWSRAGCFMHSINHPKLSVIADVATELLGKLGLSSNAGASAYLPDEHADGPVWPVFPEIAQRLGIQGSYHFKLEKGLCPADRPVVMLNLLDFIEGSFEAFSRHDKTDLSCDRMAFEQFQTLDAAPITHGTRVSKTPEMQRSERTSPPRLTPYSNLPAHQFWRRAVSGVPIEQVDPVVSSPFRLSRSTRVATAGSCFAQHISKTLRRHGFNYYVAEAGDGLSIDQARQRQFGVFSARFGNVYTSRQLLQLFERAYGTFVPAETEWHRVDGRYVDPFRPQIESDGYDSAESVATSRRQHLQAVRHMFETMEVLIFTLGLTEAWRSKADGAVFPLAPGVAGGDVDSTRYEFVNFCAKEVITDLERFLALLRQVNPLARVVLTVSPVPLIATYEQQHVLVATTYSKSVLRAAAGEICARHENCSYFPSYEIITGNYTRGIYYEADLRNITGAGVDHVMRLFLRYYSSEDGVRDLDPSLMKELSAVNEIICDEEAINR